LRLQLGLSVVEIGGIKDVADLDAAPDEARPGKRVKPLPDAEDGEE
jgi:hypothetical protein